MSDGQKIPILGTGLSGLVGSKFVELYQDQYDFQNIDRTVGIDITNEAQIKDIIFNSQAEHVIHFAAFTDVNIAHQQRGDKTGIAYQVNVLGTRYIAQAVKAANKHLVHISTDFVFDGEKQGLYVEEDPVNPIEWYGQTKAWAEEEVVNSGANAVIFRISFPYRQDEFSKMDMLHRIKKQLENGTLPPMFIDHTFTPTKIEEFSKTIDFAIQNNLTGLFHASTDPVTTDYEFAMKVKEQFGLSGDVKQGSLAEYLKTAQRPYQKNTAMSTEKLKILFSR